MSERGRGVVYMEQIRGVAYMSIGKLAEEFDYSTKTVQKIVDGMRKEIEKGRYDRHVILPGYGRARVNVYAFIDFLCYAQELEEKNARKRVPEFDESVTQRIAGMCGYCQRAVMESDLDTQCK